jgi:hypothetical protein
MFSGFIWSPAFDNYMDILNEINNNYTVINYYIYDFDKNKIDYEKSILDIYSTDDIEISKVKNVKIKNMIEYKFKYIFFTFDIKDPDYRIKEKFNTKISKTVESIKSLIRTKYKQLIKSYVHDIIIHITDNTEQNKKLQEIMKKYKKYIKYTFMNTRIFLKHQFNKNIFTRVDILIRKYSIEEYL